jgi:hypothetical protein
MERCVSITNDLLSRPLFRAFAAPVNPIADGLIGYEKKVSRPMDLGTISQNLAQRRYFTTQEWYDDMRLVFQNALDYHSPEAIWWFIAKYGMGEFERMAVGLNVADQQKWMDSLKQVSVKFAKIVANPPAPEKTNPLIADLRQKAEQSSMPSKELIGLGVEKLNGLLENDTIRKDVYDILREIEGMSIEEASRGPVDAEKLSPVTVSALLSYVGSRSA